MGCWGASGLDVRGKDVFGLGVVGDGSEGEGAGDWEWGGGSFKLIL